jgi:hypothetical protein
MTMTKKLIREKMVTAAGTVSDKYKREGKDD